MPRSSSSSTKKVRRTNLERTAETRGRLIDATIELLHEEGHAGTTTISVAERAGVSRGAMMHHFSSRSDLLLTVAQHILDQQRRDRAAKLVATEVGLPRFESAADVSWEVQRQPGTIAFLEIMMATRSDPALYEGMQPLAKRIVEMRRESAKRMADEMSIDDTDTLNAMLRLHLAALRGFSIELMFTRDQQEIERARQLLVRFERALVRELIQGSRKKKQAAKR
jgi:AcrR family transcriptional regulator